MTVDQKFPVLELFNRLQEAGLPLGLDEYQLVLRALQSGFGIEDREALARLCGTVWVKSNEEKLLFDYHFEQVMEEYEKDLRAWEELTSLEEASKQLQEEASENSDNDEKPVPRRGGLALYLALGGTIVVVAGIGLWYFSPQIFQCRPSFTSRPSEERVKKGKEYRYEIKAKACSGDDPSKLEITAKKKPPWLTLTDRKNGTATLSGTPNTSEEADNEVVLQVQVRDHASTTTEQRFRLSSDVNYTLYIIGLLLLLLVLSGGYVLARWIVQRYATPESNAEPQGDEESSSPPTDTATSPSERESIPQLDDEVEVAKAVQQSARSDTEISRNPFSEINEYFPVTRRQMKQSWRYLRRFVREGLPTELDVEATVRQVCNQGLLLEPVLVPRRVNRSELLLLIDRDGSMQPFHSLSERFIDTAVYGGRLARADVYYFHNCPDQYVYHDPNHWKAEPIKDLLPRLRQSTGVLIFSDAGAARGGWNPERLDLTQEFLNKLKQHVRYVAWINPMPRERWNDTTAGEVARLVPMFEFHRQGLQEAISVLRGKLIHHRV